MIEWISGPPQVGDDGLVRPGVLLEFEDGTTYLVGHVNQLNGVCNDCPSDYTLVDAVRHRVVWSPDA